eukprot:6395991-Ditylum_brightwellii.AAC.1
MGTTLLRHINSGSRNDTEHCPPRRNMDKKPKSSPQQNQCKNPTHIPTDIPYSLNKQLPHHGQNTDSKLYTNTDTKNKLLLPLSQSHPPLQHLHFRQGKAPSSHEQHSSNTIRKPNPSSQLANTTKTK